MAMTLGEKETVISHGKASFMKQERLAKLLREGGKGQEWEGGRICAPLPARVHLFNALGIWGLYYQQIS